MVTIYDHVVTMMEKREKTVKVAELKAGFSAYLRAVRKGHPVTVCDRDTPIARLVPYEEASEPLSVREPLRALRDVKFPRPLRGKVDSLAALMEERDPSR